jgi:hypothetical protein
MMTRNSKVIGLSLTPSNYARLSNLAADAGTPTTTLAAAILTAVIDGTFDDSTLGMAMLNKSSRVEQLEQALEKQDRSLSSALSEIVSLKAEQANAKVTLTNLRRETTAINRWLAQSFLDRIRPRPYVASAQEAAAKSNSVRVTPRANPEAPARSHLPISSATRPAATDVSTAVQKKSQRTDGGASQALRNGGQK